MRPTIGINTFVWYSPLTDARLAELLPKVANWGFETVELVLENPGDWDPALAADLAAEHHLDVAVAAVMPPGRDLTVASSETVAQTQEYLLHCIDIAARIGATVVGGPLYTAVGRTWPMTVAERAAAMRDLTTALLPLADAAGEAGVTLGIEPLNRYESSMINTVEQLMELLDGLPTSIGGVYDVYHGNIEETDPVEALRTLAPRLASVQVCSNTRGAPGQDHHDWAGFGQVLAEINYAGSMSIESFTADNEIIAAAAAIWRPLAPSQDELATTGLEFLRSWRDTWATSTP